MKIKKIALLLFFFTIILNSQESLNSSIVEYNRLVSKLQDRDRALSLSNRLIAEKNIEKQAYGFAGKAYVHALRSEYKIADGFFEKALIQLSQTNSKNTVELKANILHLKSKRYIESQELVTAIDILNEAINLCSENCHSILDLKLQSSLGRAYSMSKKHMKALEISNKCLTKIGKFSDYATNNDLKIQYSKELVSAANRSINLYLSDREKYSSYLDSTQRYARLSKDYSEKYQVSNYESYIAMINADINFYQRNYKTAKEYYEEALVIFKKGKHSKKIAQALFKIAECYYNLENYDEAETIFLNQINTNVWPEFQLLDNEAQCYFYLFKISKEKDKPIEALNYASNYGEKIKEYHEIKNEHDLKVNDIVHLRDREKEIEDYNQKYQSQKEEKNIYLYSLLISIVVVSLLIAYFIYVKKRDKENISKLNLRIEELQQDISKQNVTKKSSLTDENALKLLRKLKDLEKEKLFQKPNYTLNMVAKKLQTNSSYLSKTVNEYLDLTFAEYSNRLRINNILLRIKEQKSLQNYTIDALAQEAGYKSVNSFNTNFKKILKVTPSQYLKEIKK